MRNSSTADSKRRLRSSAAVAVLFAAQLTWAAVPVVESQPIRTTPSAAQPAAAQPTAPTSGNAPRAYGATSTAVPPSSAVGSGTSAATMFQQLQQLQDEVAELRGIVEEQSHLIEKLQAEQKEQYLDVDRRLSAMRGQGEAGGGAAVNSSADGATSEGPTGGGPRPTGNAEQDAYTAAYGLAKANRYDDAIAAFNQQLVSYPNGKFAGNAYYWLGELYLKLPQPAYEKSRQSFAQVVNQYKDNAHVSEAMFKLGVVYDRLGDRAKAMEYLTRVQSQYPGTPGAKLAKTYAAELR